MEAFAGGDERPLDHQSYRDAARAWLERHSDELDCFRSPPDDLDGRVEHLVAFRRVLWDSGLARYGWPSPVGGAGGDALHRGILLELLARHGFPPPMALDHLEIIAPTLERFLDGDDPEGLVRGTLGGDILWCQGFSEPEAGSDLTSLRLRADRTEGGWRINGRKIWSSWATTAHRCLFLGRTGGQGARGLTMFQVPMGIDGLTQRPIMQANWQPEFSELLFEDVEVPESAVLGQVDHGWDVARFLLSCERGVYAWQRHGWLAQWLGAAIDASEPDGVTQHEFQDAAVRVLALRALSRGTLATMARGSQPDVSASVDKVMLSRSEQYVFETIRHATNGDLELGLRGRHAQELFLASRVASIFGGAREIQMDLVARRLMGLPHD